MELGPVSDTGIEIPAILFGAGAVFRGEPADRVETVRGALDPGVWVDTAELR